MTLEQAPIYVKIPVEADGDEMDLKTYFGELISEDSDSLLITAFDLTIPHDHRVSVGLVEIEEVEEYPTYVSVHYRYEYHGYMGCKDYDLNDDDSGTVAGVRDGDRWVFKPHIYPERQSPNEEL